MPEQRIVGIDPGSHHLGFSCILKSGNSLKLLSAETIHAKKTDVLFERLDQIRIRLNALLDDFKPSVVAIENIFSAKNVKSAFYLGVARGVVFSSCMERRIKIFEYAPTQVKSIVTGSGRADKEQVRKMVGILIGQKLDLGFDATDAVAIAICHAAQVNLLSKLSC